MKMHSVQTFLSFYNTTILGWVFAVSSVGRMTSPFQNPSCDHVSVVLTKLIYLHLARMFTSWYIFSAEFLLRVNTYFEFKKCYTYVLLITIIYLCLHIVFFFWVYLVNDNSIMAVISRSNIYFCVFFIENQLIPIEVCTKNIIIPLNFFHIFLTL